ncbi:MAG: carotenoid 1,2-hydratase [Acidobacteriota bacterium]|nr:carotenoid 1,2-hydratase [Acidobacteriota bacterium]
MSRQDRGPRGGSRVVRTVVLAGALLASCGHAVGQEESGGVERSMWKAADPGYELVFPRDHAAHPEHRIEWWYYTGNLRASNGRRFGYQLTFFRFGVDREPVNPSRWAVRDLYMAHFAVTDIERDAHHVAERLNRAGIGWAGASTETLNVWNDGWVATLDDGDRRTQRLAASSDDGGLVIDLRLDPSAPPVLHGVNGFSQKGAEVGNASHYYSLTRLRTTGRLVVGAETFDVEGLSWMDHEFGTSFLEPAQAGWDWFSIQLDDGTDLMVYVMRRTDGARDPRSSGTLVAPEGTVHLRVDDFRLTPGRRWTSPASGAAYPVTWRVEIPPHALDLEVRAAVDAQELETGRSTGVTYWEGAINVRGTRNGVPVAGSGYLEMTGYAGAPMSTVLR